MARLMLVQPWGYRDENIERHDLAHEWRNGPYSLLLLATELVKARHEVVVIDMARDVVVKRGNVSASLAALRERVISFRPDIIGFGFFSIHYFEVRDAVRAAREACSVSGIDPLFIAGGIHASLEPIDTIKTLGFDSAFVGEADLGILKLADGTGSGSIRGVVGGHTREVEKGEEVADLNSLPFVDWSLCDYRFYTTPSYGKVKFRAYKTLDLMMGRGCAYKCAFCAYSALSSVRFYSPYYLVDQIDYMSKHFGIDSVYFIDSTVGNNRPLLAEYCELMIKRGLSERIHWFANMRPNQVNEDLLRLMWRAGCRFLLYGFESGSQRVLDLMTKAMKVEANYRVAETHRKLGFPYHASIILGYPGEQEGDILETLDLLRETKPPMAGINLYVPLPGSTDYRSLKERGAIDFSDPSEWRRIGEVNGSRIYGDVAKDRFQELHKEACLLARGDTGFPYAADILTGTDESSSLMGKRFRSVLSRVSRGMSRAAGRYQRSPR